MEWWNWHLKYWTSRLQSWWNIGTFTKESYIKLIMWPSDKIEYNYLSDFSLNDVTKIGNGHIYLSRHHNFVLTFKYCFHKIIEPSIHYSRTTRYLTLKVCSLLTRGCCFKNKNNHLCQKLINSTLLKLFYLFYFTYCI